MPKINLTFYLLLLGGLFLNPVMSFSKFGPELGAIVTSVKGTVHVQEKAQKKWILAEKGYKCTHRSTLRTGTDGSVELMFEDGTAVRLESNSRLIIGESRRKGTFRQFFLRLFKGRIISNVGKRNKYGKAKYRVNTPVCVAAVRGTVFVVDHSSMTSHVSVYEGEVETISTGPAQGKTKRTPVKIGKNKQTSVHGGENPSSPRSLSAEMESYRDTIAEHFNKQAETYRRDMEALQDIHKKYMENRAQKYRDIMENQQDHYRKIMEERRRKNQGR